jgi:predicted Zn-dependent protease
MSKANDAADKKDYQEAVRLLQPLTQSEPGTAAVGILLGWFQIQSGDLDGGLSTLRAQVARTPTPSGFKRLAISLKTAGRTDESLTVWRQAYAKFLAAHRAGIKRVVLPRANQKDLRDLPEEVRNEMQFVFADRVEDVLAAMVPDLVMTPARAA